MQWIVRILAGATMMGLLAAAPASIAAESVIIENKRGAKVKVCTYRSDDKSLIRPRKCWMLKDRAAATWDRQGDESNFDVRIFGPGVFELPICLKRNIGRVTKLVVVSSRQKTCVNGFEPSRVAARIWASGDRVLVNRSDDDYWYPAIVTGRNGDTYRLRYASGRSDTASADLLIAEQIAAGAVVEVNWKGQGRWYSGRVQSRENDRLKIDYVDGWSSNDELFRVRVATKDLIRLPDPKVQ